MNLDLAPDFHVTPELLTSAIGIIGVRGSGKTTTAGVVVEEAIRIGVPAVITDPTGAWFGLKSSADGKSAGLPAYVFGGEHADVPLEPDAGKIIGQFVVEKRVPSVLDLSLMTKGQQIRFVADFHETVYHLNREPLLVVVDETARFCPQSARGLMSPDVGRCIGAIDDIAALGRRRGLGCVLIGQRAARINKDVLTQCHTMIAMQITSPQDRKAINEWVEEQHGGGDEAREFLKALTTLGVGEGFVWSPSLLKVFKRVKFRNRHTFDSSATPKIGHKSITPKVFASVDLSVLTAEIAAAKERATADDPRRLRARIAELENELSSAKRVELVEKIVEKPVSIDDELEELSTFVQEADASITQLREVVMALQNAAASLRVAPVAPAQGALQDERSRIGTVEKRSREAAVEPRPTRAPALPRPSDGSISGPDRKFLDVLARRDRAKTTKRQLGALAGYSPKSSTFANYVSSLRVRGYISVDGGAVSITSEGRRAIGAPNNAKPLTPAELVDGWCRMLGGKPAAMLRVVVDVYPRDLVRSELAERVGLSSTSSTFANYLSELRSNGLVTVKSAVVRANAEELMLGAQ